VGPDRADVEETAAELAAILAAIDPDPEGTDLRSLNALRRELERRLR
jgi:hypothetical protein